jgi:hypothetical protein
MGRVCCTLVREVKCIKGSGKKNPNETKWKMYM